MEGADLNAVARIESNESSPWNLGAIGAELVRDSGVQLVALSGKDIVGYCCCRYAAPEAELLKIAVEVRYRRQRIASGLVRYLIRELLSHGVSALFLEVRSKNESAIQFYHRMGFTEVGRRYKYYRQPEDDALILVNDNLKLAEGDVK